MIVGFCVFAQVQFCVCVEFWCVNFFGAGELDLKRGCSRNCCDRHSEEVFMAMHGSQVKHVVWAPIQGVKSGQV